MFVLAKDVLTKIQSSKAASALGSLGRARSAYGLLGQIEEWRLEYGRPASEPRHPAYESGMPWPPPPPSGWEVLGTGEQPAGS
jgi:hypothetical protein